MPKSIVAYRAPLLTYAPYARRMVSPKVAAAVRAGYTAYKYRKYGYKIAKWGANRWRARNKAKKAKLKKLYVGDRPTKRGPSNRAEVSKHDRVMSTRAMYTTDITNLAKHTTVAATGLPGGRNTNVINLSGFKYCFELRNNLNKPINFHIAVVVPKQPASFALSSHLGFFRAQSGTIREADFDTNLTGNEFRCLPINSAKFHILQHQRFQIAPAKTSGTYNKDGPKNWATRDKYVNLKNRRFTYTDSNSPMQPKVYLIHWCDQHDAAGGSASVSSALNTQERVITYFRDKYGG